MALCTQKIRFSHRFHSQMFLYRLWKVNSSEKLDKTGAAARPLDLWCCGHIYRSLIYGGNKRRINFLNWISASLTTLSRPAHPFAVPWQHMRLVCQAVCWCWEEHKAHRPLLSKHKLLFCQKHVEVPTQLVPTKGKLTSSHNTCRAAGTNAWASKQQITVPLVGKENFSSK